MSLLLCSMGVLFIGAALSFAAGRSLLGARLGPAVCVVGCLAGLLGALSRLISAEPVTFVDDWGLPVGRFGLLLDPLACLFLLPVFLLGAASALYGASSLRHQSKTRNLGAHWGFFLLTVLGLVLSLTADNVFLFLLAWEVMSIAPFFCITLNHEREDVRQAGRDYLVAAHIGAAFILGMFLYFGQLAGSLNFAAMDSAALGAREAGLLFLLALIGFGAKAGYMPVHVWLPRAHPAAPSHVSAFLSGALIKAGLYGLLRVMTLLGPAAAWQGMVLILVGLVTAVLAMIFALARQDLKTILAYSSVENIGIMLAGLGVGVFGLAQGLPALSLLGFAGALLHLLNHALIKGLLFFSAGAVLHATGTTALSRLGGLIKRMPVTAAGFGLGAVAIAGLPPLNGFTGELLIYLGAGKTAFALDFGPAVLFWLVVAGLALVGGLAAAVMCKAFGLAFLGEARDVPSCQKAHDPGPWESGVVIGLALSCLAITFAAPLVLKLLLPVVVQLAGPADPETAHLAVRALSMTALVAAVLLGLVGLLALVRFRFLARGPVGAAGTWDCGYLRPTPRMQYSGDSFAEPLTSLLAPLSGVSRKHAGLGEYFPRRCTARVTAQDWIESGIRKAFTAFADLCERLHGLQHGRTHLYILTVLATLVLLLAVRGW